MGRCLWILIFLWCFSMSLMVACGQKKEPAKREKTASFKEVEMKARETVEAETTFTQQRMEEYQKKIEARLKEYDKKLDELKVRAERKNGEGGKSRSRSTDE